MNWEKSKVGINNQHKLKENGFVHILFKSKGGWEYVRWDEDFNKSEYGRVAGNLKEAKQHVEGRV